MIALKMEDLKGFTSKLFVGDTFDAWLVREASVTTFNVFTIDGRVRHGYYTDTELELNQIEEYSSWKVIRPICFSLIKGKKLPGSFQITLLLPPKEVEGFLKDARLDFKVEQIGGLYLNIRYEEGELHCVTGMSLNIFTLDKQIGYEWDETVRRYLKERELPFTEL